MVVSDDQSGAVIHCSQCDRPLTIPAVQAPPPPPIAPPALVDEEPAIVVNTMVESRTHSRSDRDRPRLQLVALALVLLALLGVIPVALALMQPRDIGPVHLERWSCAVLLVGILELAYAVYLLQLPDWSSMRVVSFVTLGIAAVYAAVAGIRLLAASGNRVMEFWELDGNGFSSSQEALWCFMMVLLTGSLSYLAGRFGAQWSRRTHDASTGNSVSGH
jgi:hypothetical protein